jgi:hypothetical protein
MLLFLFANHSQQNPFVLSPFFMHAYKLNIGYNMTSKFWFMSIGFQPKLSDQWNAGNRSEGCTRNPPLGCQVNQSGDGFHPLANIKWPDFSYWMSTVGDENGCKNACLNNCSCGAYVYTTTTGCLVWGDKLIDIHELPTGSYTLNLKLPASELRK